jgi:hypothetical protein
LSLEIASGSSTVTRYTVNTRCPIERTRRKTHTSRTHAAGASPPTRRSGTSHASRASSTLQVSQSAVCVFAEGGRPTRNGVKRNLPPNIISTAQSRTTKTQRRQDAP